jgi:Sec-independent protein translocase protein TatA
VFGVSYMELVIIGLVALIVIGPEQLPALATRLGRLMRTFNMARWDLTRQFDEATRAPFKKENPKIGPQKTEVDITASPEPSGDSQS